MTKMTYHNIIFKIFWFPTFWKYLTLWWYDDMTRTTDQNIIFDNLESLAFWKYYICWVFSAFYGIMIWWSSYDNMMSSYEDLMTVTHCQDHILSEKIGLNCLKHKIVEILLYVQTRPDHFWFCWGGELQLRTNILLFICVKISCWS